MEAAQWQALAYFQGRVDKHLDLVDRRRWQAEKIPAAEKIFSVCEPHTEWIAKGKQRPAVELGQRLWVATDQPQLIQDYDVRLGQADVDQSVAVADRRLGRYGAGRRARVSFDQGFTRAEDRALLRLDIPDVVLPTRGKKTARPLRRGPSRWTPTSWPPTSIFPPT